MILAGVDPHYTQLAFSMIEYTPEAGRQHLKSCYYNVPDLKKKKDTLKATQRVTFRLKQIFILTYQWIADNNPDSIGIETFVGFENAEKGVRISKQTIIKMSAAVTAVQCACFAHGKMPMMYYPVETRWKILGKGSGSKEAIWEETFSRYPELKFPVVAESKKEHLYDSLAVAEDVLLDRLEEIEMKGEA
jgi:Holliday junction resolvasome RuvABC endonuclease subunit